MRLRSPACAASILVATVVALTGVSLPAPPAAASAADPGLRATLTEVLSDSRSSRARTAAAVLDAHDGTLLFSRYGAGARIPASNTKILTAVAALDKLGPDYRFRTDVIRRGTVRDGIVEGNLYLKGYGDPTTRQADLRTLAATVRAQGITRVTGRLIVDASHFDQQRYNRGWSRSYAQDYYAPEISALTVAADSDLNSGTVLIRFRAGRRGEPARISTVPAAAKKYLRIANRSTTSAGGSRTTLTVRRSYASRTVRIGGRLPAGRSASRLITVPAPHLYAGAIFRAELNRQKITVDGPTASRRTPSGRRTVIARDRSMPLRSLVRPFLKYSNNAHAEALTKQMGVRSTGRGTWSDGLAVTRAYLAELGTPMTGVRLRDGSGLTRANRLTPLALTTVLYRVQSEPWFEHLYAALPVAGVADRPIGGTLRLRMNGTRADGNARAKTGSLTGVTALSGYVSGRDGRRYVFSLLSNYRATTPRPVENTFVVALANRRR